MLNRIQSIKACYLGLVDYSRALQFQAELVNARSQGFTPDLVLLLQHPHVYTLGRFRGQSDVLIPQEMLANKGIDLVPTSRGGSITYHGPGQLIGYPIIDLKENKIGIKDYVWMLEEVVIRTLNNLGIVAQRHMEKRGVWVNGKKVCSIGIAVKRHVTMHGFAINVNPDLTYFSYIRPCGMSSDEMTSLALLTAEKVTVHSVLEQVVPAISEVFKKNCEMGEIACIQHASLTG